MNYLLVFIGGGLGSMLRHLVNVVSPRLLGTAFPYHTFIINISGSIVMGLIAGAATPGGPVVGFSLGAVALKAGGGAPQVIAYVVAWALFAFPAAAAVGNPLHAGAVCLVPRGGVAAVPVSGCAIAMAIGRP